MGRRQRGLDRFLAGDAPLLLGTILWSCTVPQAAMVSITGRRLFPTSAGPALHLRGFGGFDFIAGRYREVRCE
jgi:hypothetical protein